MIARLILFAILDCFLFRVELVNGAFVPSGLIVDIVVHGKTISRRMQPKPANKQSRLTDGIVAVAAAIRAMAETNSNISWALRSKYRSGVP